MLALLPLSTYAKKYYDDYKTMGFKETLASEKIEIADTTYSDDKEDDKVAVIYLFRGQGCKFCRAFLEYLNSISKDYGKYFKVVSFEVWYDSKNNELFNKVAALNGADLTKLGVPYYVIGNEVFSGYREDYNENIKKAIMNQYQNHDGDVFEKLEKSEKPKSETSSIAMIFWIFLFVAFGTFVSCMVSAKNTEKVMKKLNEIQEDQNQKNGRSKKTKEE